MFDIGATELLVIAVVAILVIGPKDMPMALRTAGRWMGKVRRISSHFRAGVESMIREAELEDMEKQWREKNRAIMAEHPDTGTDASAEMQPLASAEAKSAPATNPPTEDTEQVAEGAEKPAAPPVKE